MSAPRPSQLSAMKLALLAAEARAGHSAILRAEPIAIVGMSCRFPGGANSPEDFWRLLRDGVDAVVEIPSTRWDVAKVYDADPAAPGKTTVRHAGLLEEIDGFDAAFFGILPREAERMDPQQRVFMEVATDALDRSGITKEKLAGSRTGVYVASYHNDYAQLQYADPDWIDSRTLTGTLHSVVANRLSYHLDLRGPSVSLDSACSSSLVAVHLACQGLRSGETDVAIAGGVSILAAPELMISLAKVGFTSVAGRCRTFDAAADGFVRGEGCGVVVLKRLSDAVAAGDRILSVVRSSVVNQDGHTTVMAAPNGLAQRDLIREALEIAGIAPSRVGFIEAHGTGTPLGDPIEVEALASAVGAIRPDGSVCYLGSAKANIGHLESAAGVVGLIKATLALQHGEIPPQINFTKLNPHLSLGSTCLRVPTSPQSWTAGSTPRVAGISSFGAGGTNAHVVIEEAPRMPAETSAESGGVWLLPLSAQSPGALAALGQRWIDMLKASGVSPGALCASAGARRSHYDYRLAVIGHSREDFRAKLEAFVSGREVAGLVRGNRVSGRPRIAFAFSGQGSQWAGMGRELLAQEGVFRQTMHKLDAEISALVSWSLLDALAAPTGMSRLGETEVAQPAIFSIQVALCELLKSWGLTPDVVIGHSIGELTALYTAGALDLKEAVRLVVLRARAMQRATGLGAMATAALDEAQARALIAPHGAKLSIGALNSPQGTVLSGDREALAAVLSQLDARGVSHRMLPVNYAFHSAQVAPLASEFRRAAGAVSARAPEIPVYSTVTGAILATPIDAGYLERNVRDPVRFAPAVQAMLEDGIDVWLEVGPHAALSYSIAECAAATGKEIVLAATSRREKPERATLLAACGSMYASARRLDWEAVNHAAAEPLDLPSYPWEHARFWLRDAPVRAAAAGRAANAEEPSGHELLGHVIDVPSGPVFRVSWPHDAPAWLADHRVGARIVVPAAAMVESFRAAAERVLGTRQISLIDVLIREPLTMAEDDRADTEWQVSSQAESGAASLSLHVKSIDGKWRLISTARAKKTTTPLPLLPGSSGAEIGAVSAATLYSGFARMGMGFGPRFRTVQDVRLFEGAAEVRLSRAAGTGDAGEAIHPTLLDGALQGCVAAALGAAAFGPAGTGGDDDRPQLLLPIAFDNYTVFAPATAELQAHVRVMRATPQSVEASVDLFAPDGMLCASIGGARFARASASAAAFTSAQDPWLYTVEWRDAPIRSAARPDGGNERWLVFAHPAAASSTLPGRLGGQGAEVLLAIPGERFERRDARTFVVNPEDPGSIAALLDECGSTPLSVLHLWSLEGDGEPSDGLTQASALHLIQSSLQRPGAIAQIVFVTRGAQEAGTRVSDAAAAGLWGLLRGVATEFPELRARIIDLDPDGTDDLAESLLPELRDAEAARMLALRGGRRRSPHLARLRTLPASEDRRLESGGTLDTLHWSKNQTAAPGAGEVTVQVMAAGVNFRDVLLAIGAYPGGEKIPLGVECAGIVTAADSVEGALRVGDRVFGFAPACFASQVTLPGRFLARVPEGVSMEQAAALPAAYLTVIYGLNRLVRLAPGMRILIHAATGGVGLAAVHFARSVGAEIFATAGSSAKRDLLRSLGVTHVFDSRSLDFADQIRDITRGAGVDVVLNSLSGDFIPASFSVLSRGGVFLELGKRGIWTREQAAQKRPDARYQPYDLGAEILADHELAKVLMSTLASKLESRELPPLPVRVFAMSDAPSALRFMAQARHVGKLVLKPTVHALDDGVQTPLVRPDATYLITGGLGGIGVRTAHWLSGEGARCIVLTGRRAPGADALEIIAACRAAGTAVHVREADAGDEAQMRGVFDDIARTMPPLRGIVHAAGALNDAILPQQTWTRWQQVLHGKAHGARVLHRLSADLPLEFFVLYSAAGVLLGPRGQAAYAAANAELDALAQMRRAAGLPALSVAWGQWAGAGMAARTATEGLGRWESLGLGWISPEEGFGRLAALMRQEVPYAAVLPIDWDRFAAAGLPDWQREFLGDVIRNSAPRSPAAKAEGQNAEPAGKIVERWRETPQSRRRERVLEVLRTQVLEVLGLPATQPLDARAALKDSGLDSLMAVEYRNVLGRLIGRQLPATLLFDYPSLDVLATHLMRLLALDTPPRSADGAKVLPASAIQAAVASLSDSEAEAALLAELQSQTTSGVS